ncbi:MAG: DnaJ domain-containing protein [Desulfatibacillaceae bacterium]
MENCNPDNSHGQLALVPATETVGRRCESCGRTDGLGRRKYCSPECRARLVRKLHVLTSLLRAIRARYAAFSFTEKELILHVIANGHGQVFTFFWQRSRSGKPADDLASMTEELGREWWREKERRNSRHQAALFVLDRAATNRVSRCGVKPASVVSPRVRAGALTVLKLDRRELLQESARDRIRSAYRTQAMAHHPDKNGDAEVFRRVQTAYEHLLQWIEAPVLRSQAGLPGKWCFDGARWTPPMTPRP